MRTLIAIALSLATVAAQAQSYSYRGTLNDSGQPANGRYDLRLSLLDEKGNGTLLAPVTLYDVEVVDGHFAVPVDFGADLSGAPAMRLQTEVQQAGGGFAKLGEPTRFDPKAALGSICWALDGNAGTNPAVDFLGTTDAQALVLRSNNQAVARLGPSNPDGRFNVVLGSPANSASAQTLGGTISGGGSTTSPNTVSANSATVGGGVGNTASGNNATVAGGDRNAAMVSQSAIGGGLLNTAGGSFSVIGGGFRNETVGISSTVSGGAENAALGANSMIAGGSFNCSGSSHSWAAGRNAKARPGADPGTGPCSGLGSYPGGIGDQGTFVWADIQDPDFVSSGSNQFLVRAAGGVGLGTNAPQAQLHVRGTGTSGNTVGVFENPDGAAFISIDSQAGASAAINFRAGGNTRASITRFDSDTLSLRSEGAIQLRTGGNTTRFQLTADGGLSLRRGPNNPDADKAIQVGTNSSTGNGAHLTNTGVWTNASSREFKQSFQAIDTQLVLQRLLAMPITRWRYQGDDGIEHLGPVAEDFRAAFGLGHDPRYIGSVDADGVALAAIQGLNAKLESENAALRAEIAALRELVMGKINPTPTTSAARAPDHAATRTTGVQP